MARSLPRSLRLRLPRRLSRIAIFLAASARLFAQSDPAFSDVPFDRWVEHDDQAHIRWNASVSQSVLSYHQRIAAQTTIHIDGSDLEKRRGKGQLLMMIQITDDQGHIFQDHDGVDLERVGETLKGNDVEYLQPFFVLPGDYRIVLAIYDNVTGEHGVLKRKLHVPQMKPDPLPEAWRGLPSVEFIANAQPPDSYYLPAIQGLDLHARPAHPLRIELIVNLTPSERLSGSKNVQNQVFAVLIPSLKVLSRLDWRPASLNIELLDLSRSSVLFRQENAHSLDWDVARAGLADAKPAIIDVKALQKRKYSADFFVKEVRDSITTDSAPRRVVIVLSRSVIFEPGVDLNPIELAPDPGLTMFYLRCQPQPYATVTRGGVAMRGSIGPLHDQLAPLLKPLNPKLFDIATPDQFRKALAAILAQIAAM